MGARRFGPDTGRFLQADAYDDALGNLSLSADPLTANRYGLAGGNPVGFVEVDGHYVAEDGKGTATSPKSGISKPSARKARATSGSTYRRWAARDRANAQASKVKGHGDAIGDAGEVTQRVLAPGALALAQIEISSAEGIST